VVGNTAQENAVHFNQGGGKKFREQRFGDASEITYNLDLGDFDGNGSTDIVVANSDGRNSIYLNLPKRR
ncbi:MAG: hypothetical protein ACI91J_003826, partial [Yoonia sp.]